MNGVFTANISDKTSKCKVSTGISITCHDKHDGIANTCILNYN